MSQKTHSELIRELSTTVAAQAVTISQLENQLESELRLSREAFREQTTQADQAIQRLSAELGVLVERDTRREREVAELKAAAEKEREERVRLQIENAALKQQLQDHLKQVEQRDSRRWGVIVALIGVLVGAVFSLASGLIVTFAKK
jgi:hypothetical protein